MSNIRSTSFLTRSLVEGPHPYIVPLPYPFLSSNVFQNCVPASVCQLPATDVDGVRIPAACSIQTPCNWYMLWPTKSPSSYGPDPWCYLRDHGHEHVRDWDARQYLRMACRPVPRQPHACPGFCVRDIPLPRPLRFFIGLYLTDNDAVQLANTCRRQPRPRGTIPKQLRFVVEPYLTDHEAVQLANACRGSVGSFLNRLGSFWNRLGIGLEKKWSPKRSQKMVPEDGLRIKMIRSVWLIPFFFIPFFFFFFFSIPFFNGPSQMLLLEGTVARNY